jgi:hypothetical protein
MPNSISRSISDLADQVARLARIIDRSIALAEASNQQLPAFKETAENNPTSQVDCFPSAETLALYPLVSVSEETPTQTPPPRPPSENVFAASVADLYERLGGLLDTALQPDPQKTELPEHYNH